MTIGQTTGQTGGGERLGINARFDKWLQENLEGSDFEATVKRKLEEYDKIPPAGKYFRILLFWAMFWMLIATPVAWGIILFLSHTQ